MIALINEADNHHSRCVEALPTLPGPLVTTWACFVEAMYLLGEYGGHPAQEELWGYVEDGILEIYTGSSGELDRIRELMRQYRDTPMDLADASLVAAAESLDETRIFTTDRHFFIYRKSNKQAFEVVP
jgi:predicted nucleic acid-binding protein